jgi:hypothetical protein
MRASFSLKSSLFMLLGALACAVGTAFLVNYLLSGPKLGPHYDFLLSRRQPPPVSREILIIETGELIESGDILSVLMTLTEMEASDLIMTGRTSPSTSPITVTEEEIRRRFVDEYVLLGTNIRNLFEAIRSGSLAPEHAPGYVERLVELTEQGRDRLLTSLVDRDEDFIRSIAVFGNYIEADTRAMPDRDGKIRRVRPIDPESQIEHPVYLAIKSRYAISKVETVDHRQVLWLRGYDGKEIDIPLDKDGNILAAWNCDFRKVDISLFRQYDEADRVMRAALEDADELGAFSQTLPEQSPLFLGDYALLLRQELLQKPDGEKRMAWLRARNNYFKSLNDFLFGPAQTLLVNGYDQLIADETSLGERGLASLARMRDDLIFSFTDMREYYGELSALRSKLEEEIASSFCIMGSEDSSLYCALLANTLITGSHIKPTNDRQILFFSIAAAFVVLTVIFLMPQAAVLIAGVFLSVLSSAAFGLFFIFYSYWIDPLVALSASLCGTLVILYCKFAVLKYRTRRFRAAYGASVSQNVLKGLIKSGRPRLSEVNVCETAVVAIKDINLLNREDNEKPRDAGSARREFNSAVKRIVFNNGGVIAGFDGDTILACFGSPLKSADSPRKGAVEIPVNKACAFVRELLNDDKIPWRFGIDSGECTFFWSAESGFSANGRPSVRARVLASKTARLQVRALITDTVREKTGLECKKAGALNDGKTPFFEFPH